MVSRCLIPAKHQPAHFLLRSSLRQRHGLKLGPSNFHREAAKGAKILMWIDRWSERVIGAAIEVHRTLGPGLLESVYETALAAEFSDRGIPFERQKAVPIRYRGIVLDGGLRLDFLIGGELILELKTVDRLTDIHRAQILTYMKVTGCPVGLLINFNTAFLKTGIKRFVRHAPE